MSEWRKIEDGKIPHRPLLCFSPEGNPIFIAFWSEARGRWIEDCNHNVAQAIYRKVTHWQPLPEPPTTTAPGEREE